MSGFLLSFSANVLRIVSRGPLDWVNLYRILEIIAANVGGLGAVASNGWATEQSLKLFTPTANSPDAVGLSARHGAPSDSH